jgi:hypothetical protein
LFGGDAARLWRRRVSRVGLVRGQLARMLAAPCVQGAASPWCAGRL